MLFSQRVDFSAPNPITTATAKARSAGRTLLNLSDSNPTRLGLAPAILPDTYQAHPRGPLSARRLLADFLNTYHSNQHSWADPELLYVLSSTSQAYAWLMTLLCDPGSAVLTPAPGYPLIDSLARLQDVEAIPYPLHWYGRWSVDLAAVEQILTGPDKNRIRALVVINPNNPTGSFLHADDIEGLVGLCARFDIPLIADEVFFDYAFSATSGTRLAGEDRVLTFSLDGLSKKLAAPHAKVAWIQVSGPDDAVDQAMQRLDVIADDFLPMSSLILHALPDLLSQVPSQVEVVRARTQKNLDQMRRVVDASKTGVTSVVLPEGGWSALLRFPSLIDEDDLVLSLIQQDGISVQPGYFFSMPHPGFISVSLLLEPDVFAHAVTRVVQRIDALSIEVPVASHPVS